MSLFAPEAGDTGTNCSMQDKFTRLPFLENITEILETL